MEIVDDRAGNMAQPPRDSVALDCVANGFRDDKPDARTIVVGRLTHCVHDEIGLHRPHPLADRGTELGRPSHPVPRRKHR
jgi:hypothetical protein